MNFKQTSDLPYDRHHYKVIFKDGREELVESWEEAYSTWFYWNGMKVIDRIEVCDIKKKSRAKSTGFGWLVSISEHGIKCDYKPRSHNL